MTKRNQKNERARVCYCVCLRYFSIYHECQCRKKCFSSAQVWSCCVSFSAAQSILSFFHHPLIASMQTSSCISSTQHRSAFLNASPSHSSSGGGYCWVRRYFKFIMRSSVSQKTPRRIRSTSQGVIIFQYLFPGKSFLFYSLWPCVPALLRKDIGTEEYSGSTLIGIPPANPPQYRHNAKSIQFFHDECHCRGQLIIRNTTERKYIMIANISKEYWII